jgi:hypothetical protein
MFDIHTQAMHTQEITSHAQEHGHQSQQLRFHSRQELYPWSSYLAQEL